MLKITLFSISLCHQFFAFAPRSLKGHCCRQEQRLIASGKCQWFLILPGGSKAMKAKTKVSVDDLLTVRKYILWTTINHVRSQIKRKCGMSRCPMTNSDCCICTRIFLGQLTVKTFPLVKSFLDHNIYKEKSVDCGFAWNSFSVYIFHPNIFYLRISVRRLSVEPKAKIMLAYTLKEEWNVEHQKSF